MNKQEQIKLLDEAIRNTKLVREQIRKGSRPPVDPDPPEVEPPPPELGEELPNLQKPTEFDWVCTPGQAVSTATGQVIRSSNPVGAAYREFMRGQRSNQRFRASVSRYCGFLQLAGGYSQYDDSVACWENDRDEWGNVDISLVGLDEAASVKLSVGGLVQYGYLDRFAAHSMAILGQNDSFVIRQHADCGEFVLDGCHFTAAPGVFHESGLHFGKDFARLIVNEFKNDAFRCQHHLFYTKGGGEILCYDSDLKGGNRSGFQDRAEADWYANTIPPTPRPHGRRVFIGNTCEGHGFDHENPDGGSVLSLYSNPDYKTIIRFNTFNDCRYGGIYLIHRKDSYHDEGDYSFKDVELEGNICSGQTEHKDPHSSRSVMSISSVRKLTFVDWPNMQSPAGHVDVMLNDPWSKGQGAPSNKHVFNPPGEKPEDLTVYVG